MPKLINIIIAHIDLLENLGSPQTPCPEVQPFPNLAPIPTNKPAIAKPNADVPYVAF